MSCLFNIISLHRNIVTVIKFAVCKTLQYKTLHTHSLMRSYNKINIFHYVVCHHLKLLYNVNVAHKHF